MKRVSTAFISLCLLLAVSAPVAAIPVLIESYNEFDEWTDGTWYATQVALKYVPSVSYSLERVEFFTGGSKAGVTIALRSDASDYPSTTILASGVYDSSGLGSWLGATFSSPYAVTAGTTYWVTWYFTEELLAPYSTGTPRTVRWGEGGGRDSYPNLYEGSGFKTKFYGESSSTVPDPGSSLLLLGMGLAGLSAWKKRIL